MASVDNWEKAIVRFIEYFTPEIEKLPLDYIAYRVVIRLVSTPFTFVGEPGTYLTALVNAIEDMPAALERYLVVYDQYYPQIVGDETRIFLSIALKMAEDYAAILHTEEV